VLPVRVTGFLPSRISARYRCPSGRVVRDLDLNKIHLSIAQRKENEAIMSIWLVILIVVLVVFLLGGFGYRSRR